MRKYRVPKEHKEIAYRWATKAYYSYGEEFTIDDAVRATRKECPFKEGSATLFIIATVNMLGSEGYRLGIGEDSTKFLFERIYEDHGEEGLKKALCSTILHIGKNREISKQERRTIEHRLNEKRQEEVVVLEYAAIHDIDITEEYRKLKAIK